MPASELKYPDYDIIKTGLQKYAGNGELIHEFFEPIKTRAYKPRTGFGIKFDEKVDKNKKIHFGYITRGCVARCTFCQRGTMSGWMLPVRKTEQRGFLSSLVGG